MNDIKKAINLIKNNKQEYEELLAENTNKGANAGIEEIIKTYDVVIKALEKQLAKKPIDTPQMWQCPNCKSHIFHEQQLMHCKQCGQLVSWRR